MDTIVKIEGLPSIQQDCLEKAYNTILAAVNSISKTEGKYIKIKFPADLRIMNSKEPTHLKIEITGYHSEWHESRRKFATAIKKAVIESFSFAETVECKMEDYNPRPNWFYV